MEEARVYIVHCIDTEGPLMEGDLLPDAILRSPERPPLPPWEDLEGVIEAHRAYTLGTWHDLAASIQHVTQPAYRSRHRDSRGGGWIFNWFCMDHVGYWDNPRQRAMGVHSIYDFYANLSSSQDLGDAVHWHFHPMSVYREAHKCATSYTNSTEMHEIITRRLIDRAWFPRCIRAGFNTERPDSHAFLEQWIPFDMSNIVNPAAETAENPDLDFGRFGDWRWAPSDWRVYHPAHDCYMLEGNCRRLIGRTQYLLNRVANLTDAGLRNAFERARTGAPTILGIGSHDWREMSHEIEYFLWLLEQVAPDYPDVEYVFSEAVSAFRAVQGPATEPPLELAYHLVHREDGHLDRIHIETKAGKVFGPQPFLGIKTRSNRYIHENLNYDTSLSSWCYRFDEHSVLADDIRLLAVAANDASGHQSIHRIPVA